jgi:hypothetical protein
MFDFQVVLFFLSLTLATFILKSFLDTRRVNPDALPYPPGPKPKPIVGNLYDIPAQTPWVTYASWKERYGMRIILLPLSYALVTPIQAI